MKVRNLRVSYNTISFKLVFILVLIVIPLLSLLIYYGYYAIRIVRLQVSESYKNMMILYMKQIDNQLTGVDTYLSYLEALDTDLHIMAFSTDQENEYNLAKIRLFNTVNKNIGKYNFIDSILFYSVPRKEFLEITNGQITIVTRESIKSYIEGYETNSVESSESSSNWRVTEIGQKYYLLRVLKNDNIYMVAVADPDKLMISLNEIYIGETGASLLVTDKGLPITNQEFFYKNKINLNFDFTSYHISGNKNRYLVVGEKSRIGNFSLVALIPEKYALEKLGYIGLVATIVVVVFILILPVYYMVLRKVILDPLNRVLIAMKKIQRGNMKIRIETYPTSDEFHIINTTFNEMIDQIERLKIDIYEEKINRQKEELRYLQLQINPHFFLNSLNIIYTSARAKNNEAVQEITLCLVEYFRFMFRSNLNFVSLQDELKHVENYLHIQQLRFPESLKFNIEVQNFLVNVPVPPLIVHTFVENSIKHAFTLDNPLAISIKIHLMEDDPSRFKILIHDTGPGFSQDVLDKLRKGEKIIDSNREHIGIWNIQRRLMLLFKDNARISFANDKINGAVIEIIMPV